MTQEKKPVKAPASVFEVLSAIDCSEHTEIKKTKWTDKKGVDHEMQLTYLSWAWAWHICKQHYPQAQYTIYETPEGRPYFDDGRTAWVKTGVTIEGMEHIEYLPIMDHRNLSIPVGSITSMDMNKAIQRSLTKALARHGLGLYIYAGEDLPWTEEEAAEREEAAKEQAAEYARQDKKAVKKAPAKKQEAAPAPDPAAPAPAPQKKQLTKEEQHAKWVVAIATGWVSKMGVPAMEAWKANVHPDEDQIAAMEDEVFNYRIDHNIKADQPNVNA